MLVVKDQIACCQGPIVQTISMAQRNIIFNLNYTFVLFFSVSFLHLVLVF